MKNFLAVVMGLLYVAAGANHFLHPGFYLKIMPSWLGYQEQLVALSGIAEILLGILLVPHKTRRYAAWGLIGLLIAVFPANIQMLINYEAVHHPQTWLAIVRLPLQGLLVWWAYINTRRQKRLPVKQSKF
ncbi:MAG TPA: DoxX family protein [Flavisolibacter sp.]|nr:DoxX family protein [Flavisolibacter sp.]